MKKYLAVASLFVLNNEIISWLTLLILAVMGLVAFVREVDKAGGFK